MKTSLTLAVTLSLGASPLLGQAASTLSSDVRGFVSVDAPVVALTGVTVIDGTGAPPRMDQSVVIVGSRIQQVGPRGQIRIPRGAEVMALEGHTVIPGLIGLHDHTFYTTSGRTAQLSFSAPRLYLASGVTTIRSTGSVSPYSELNLKRAIEDGEVPGPRMHVTGPYITGGTGSSDMNRLSGPEDARRVVAYWAGEGATWFKAYTEISREELAAAIDEAHRHGVKVTGHLCSVSFREAVALGIDNLEHGLLTNTDYHPDKQVSQCPAANQRVILDLDLASDEVKQTMADMVDNEVALTSTLAVYELFVPRRPPIEDRMLEAMAPEVRAEYLATRERLDLQSGTSPMTQLFRKAMDFEVAFVRSGGLLAAGVDPTGNGGALPGFGDQRNYELLLESGFSPEETIQIMTLNGARVLGVDNELGSVEAGKVADLVVIDGDIAAQPATIRNVVIVFKDGVGYDSAGLIESVRGVVGIR